LWLPPGADEASIKGAGNSDVSGAVDDGAAVGEESEGVRAAAEAEKEVVGAEVFDVSVVPVSIRLSPDVVEAFRASGADWQARVDEILREHIK
jgi:uncharacterized protein (DUF4415 family)